MVLVGVENTSLHRSQSANHRGTVRECFDGSGAVWLLAKRQERGSSVVLLGLLRWTVHLSVIRCYR